jgi:hypothetical protein
VTIVFGRTKKPEPKETSLPLSERAMSRTVDGRASRAMRVAVCGATRPIGDKAKVGKNKRQLFCDSDSSNKDLRQNQIIELDFEILQRVH